MYQSHLLNEWSGVGLGMRKLVLKELVLKGLVLMELVLKDWFRDLWKINWND